MPVHDLLKIGVVIAALYALLSLAFMIWRTARLPRKPSYASPSGSESRGVKYVFTKGMMPGEKESVRDHLPTFIGGALYHLGILISAAFLVVVMIEIELPEGVLWPARVCVAAGLASGLGLVIKRIALGKMRIISVPDDYIANALVDLYLLSALLASFSTHWVALFTAVATVLLVYLPLGKIRHCVFYFYTRVQFGRLFGRRGVLPHPAREER